MLQFPQDMVRSDHGQLVQNDAEGAHKQELELAWLILVAEHVLDQVMKQDHVALQSVSLSVMMFN